MGQAGARSRSFRRTYRVERSVITVPETPRARGEVQFHAAAAMHNQSRFMGAIFSLSGVHTPMNRASRRVGRVDRSGRTGARCVNLLGMDEATFRALLLRQFDQGNTVPDTSHPLLPRRRDPRVPAVGRAVHRQGGVFQGVAAPVSGSRALSDPADLGQRRVLGRASSRSATTAARRASASASSSSAATRSPARRSTSPRAGTRRSGERSGEPRRSSLGSRRGRGGGVAVGDGHLLVHRSRGFDAPVGGTSRRDAGRRWLVTTRSCATAIESHAGHVVKTTGDGVHAVFATADEALRRRDRAQRALGAEPWAVSEPLRVRMGIHTGEAELRDGDYFGAAAESCGAADGSRAWRAGRWSRWRPQSWCATRSRRGCRAW